MIRGSAAYPDQEACAPDTKDRSWCADGHRIGRFLGNTAGGNGQCAPFQLGVKRVLRALARVELELGQFDAAARARGESRFIGEHDSNAAIGTCLYRIGLLQLITWLGLYRLAISDDLDLALQGLDLADAGETGRRQNESNAECLTSAPLGHPEVFS